MNKLQQHPFVLGSCGVLAIFALYSFALWLSPLLQLPAALIGLLILLACFIILGRIPRAILLPWQFMLKHMSLFFVPAFVSIPLYQSDIVEDFSPMFFTVFISTLVGMAVLGKLTDTWFGKLLTRKDDDA
jgi:holin-like protein